MRTLHSVAWMTRVACAYPSARLVNTATVPAFFGVLSSCPRWTWQSSEKGAREFLAREGSTAVYSIDCSAAKVRRDHEDTTRLKEAMMVGTKRVERRRFVNGFSMILAMMASMSCGAESNSALPVSTATPPAERAFNWTLTDMEGKSHSLSDYQGKMVLLNFWAAWCGPCRVAMPVVQRLHEKFGGRALVVFGVNSWEKEDAADYVNRLRESKTSLWPGDPAALHTYGLLLNGELVAKELGIELIPAFVLYGVDGSILMKKVGEASSHEPSLEEAIELHMKSNGL